jgi:hypothetical protein
LTTWANEPTLSQLKQDYDDAKTESNSHITDVDNWLDNLNIEGTAKMKVDKKRSSIQPKLIRKNAEWRYSSLSEPFLSTPDVFNVYPKGSQDKQSAYENELILNHQFNTQIDKVDFIDECVRTVVDEGSAIIRVGWDYEEEVIETEFPIYDFVNSKDPEYIAELQKLMQLAQEKPDVFAAQPEHIQQAVQFSMQNKAPIQAVQVNAELVTETKVIKNQPTVDVCDYRAIILDPTCQGKIKNAKFAVYEFSTCRADLEKDDKYSNLESMDSEGGSVLGDPDFLSDDNTSFNFQDKARKKIMAYEYWGYWDIENTGKVKPFVATWVGKTLIRMEESPFPFNRIPFTNIKMLPKRKSLYGEPDGALIEDNQKIVGAVTRGMIDILASNAAGQRGYRKDALDAINKRRFKDGSDYEYNGNVDPRAGFHTHTFPEIPQSAQFVIQSQNVEAESLTGVKAFSQGISGQALGESVGNGRGALDAASKRELGILRRIAAGVIDIGSMIVAMNAEFLADDEIVRVTDEEFVSISRENLAGNYDLRLTISTAEEDNAKAQELAFMLQTTAQGSDPEEVRMIRAEIARLRKMPALAKRIEDFKPAPDPMQELNMQFKQAEIAEVQARTQEYLAQAQLHAAKAQETGSKKDLNNLDYVEQESGVKQERDLEKSSEQAKANAKLKLIEANLKDNTPKQ